MTIWTLTLDRQVLRLALLACAAAGLLIGVAVNTWLSERRCPWCGIAAPRPVRRRHLHAVRTNRGRAS